jgi:hypothetical protein
MKTIFLFVLIASGTICFSQNLIVNPDLESWTKTTQPYGWTTADKCLKDSVNVHSGTYSCKQYATLSATKSVGQIITVTEGKKYILSFYFKTEVTGTEHGCRIWCHWEDAVNNTIVDPATDAVLKPSTYMKSDSWQQFSVEITAPASANYFILEVRTYQNSIAYLDDFLFEESVPTQLMEDPEYKTIIYPNPASDHLFIKSPEGIRHIEVLDLKGSKVLSSEHMDEFVITLNLHDLAPGAYLIRIYSNKKVFIKKFIKKD